MKNLISKISWVLLSILIDINYWAMDIANKPSDPRLKELIDAAYAQWKAEKAAKGEPVVSH